MVEHFQIHILTETPGVVRGRCWEGFGVGTAFTHLNDAARPVSLTVQEIRVHDKPVEALDPVWTAELVLTGEGVEDLALEDVLCRAP